MAAAYSFNRSRLLSLVESTRLSHRAKAGESIRAALLRCLSIFRFSCVEFFRATLRQSSRPLSSNPSHTHLNAAAAFQLPPSRLLA